MADKLPPLAHMPLAVLPAVSLDLETTGLDVRNDRAVQVGAVVLQGAAILETPRLDRLINPGVPIPEAVSRIHGLNDADVAHAPPFAGIVESLLDILAGRVVIGHHVAFDLAVLRHEAARAGVPWRDPPMIDVAILAGILEPTLPDLGLETVTNHLGVEIKGRHSAIGDALATAQVYAQLLPRLRQRDIRTLGEAQALIARREDLHLKQAEAGWHAIPGEAVAAAEEGPRIFIDSHVFERRLKDVMAAPPVFADKTTPLHAAARLMVERRIGALLIGDSARPPEGIVTERDLLRAAANGFPGGLDTAAVTTVMAAPVESMDGGEMLYRALARMDRRNIRHLCIIDERGRAVGMVSQRDLLHHRTRQAVMLDDTLATAGNAHELAAAYSRVPDIARQLENEGLSGLEVARVISGELRAMSARAAELAIGRLATDGRGPAPAPWCLLLLGSAGRGESLLGADQDNAIVHEGTEADDAWFAEMGAHIAEFLDEAGIPRCKGGVMASNAEWRGSTAAWHKRVETWLSRARPEDLLNVDIFFDMMPVAGDTAIGRALHAQAVAAAAKTPPFLALLAEAAVELAPQFGLLGTLKTDENGRIDLKRNGLLSLTNFARTLALKAGSTANATPDRLRDAVEAGRIGLDDATVLISLHAELLTAVLRQQLLDLGAGIKPSGRVAVRDLARAGRARLRQQLHRLDGIVQNIRDFMT